MESKKNSNSASECEKLSLQTEQLSQLVCPVCYEYMKPPIMTCENNHGICELCYELLTDCPICGSTLTYRRSSHLELLTNLVLFPCKNCHIKYSLDELTTHKCQIEDEPNLICLIAQIHGNCSWKGSSKDMLQHIGSQHIDNYWTKRENSTKWNYCQLSSFGIQQIFVVDLVEAIFIIVQKYDPNMQCLQWNISCQSEKSSNQYIYEIQLYSNEKSECCKFRNVVENEQNILNSLPDKNLIKISTSKVAEYLDDNNYVNYKVIIHNKDDLLNKQDGNSYEVCTEVSEVRNNNFEVNDSNLNEKKENCTRKMWVSVVDCYNYVKKRLGC